MKINTILAAVVTATTLVLAAAPALAQVRVEGAWARASVQGQKATGAFMKITAPQAMRLVGVASPVAGVAEVHEMKMDGDVMRMRAVDGVDLPAGKAVELKPGGYHVMLLDLKAPLMKDTAIPLTLTLRDARGVQSKVELSVPVGIGVPGGGGAPAHKH